MFTVHIIYAYKRSTKQTYDTEQNPLNYTHTNTIKTSDDNGVKKRIEKKKQKILYGETE